MKQPGPLFPASWASSFSISRGSACVVEGHRQGALNIRSEYNGEAAVPLLQMLKASAPVFEQCTEEAMRFRIYQLGSLEIRTTKEVGCKEEVGIVFSIRAPTSSCSTTKGSIEETARISKVTEYVERAFPPDAKSGLEYRHYLVLETGAGHKIATEYLREGEFAWEEDPADLEDRNSLAKVLRTKLVKEAVTLHDVKAHCDTLCQGTSTSVSTQAARKDFIHRLYSRSVDV